MIFRPLSRETLEAILDLQLQEVYARLQTLHLTLQVEPDARELLLRKGYDPANGARPLRRAIQHLLTRPLSTALLEERFQAGEVVRVAAKGDKLVLYGVRNAQKPGPPTNASGTPSHSEEKTPPEAVSRTE